MLKLAVVWSFLLVAFLASAQNKMPSVEEVLKPAYERAAKENKNVLLIFHASWCGWCHRMDTSLQDKSVRPLIDEYYITIHLTVYESKDKKALENPGALQFLTAHHGGDQGIPYWLILDREGKVLANSEMKPGQNVGCPATEEEVTYFSTVLQKTSSLKKEELEMIKKRFRMNEQKRNL